MSTLSVQLPNSLHKHLQELAEREGISIDQFIATAVAEKMAALMTYHAVTLFGKGLVLLLAFTYRLSLQPPGESRAE